MKCPTCGTRCPSNQQLWQERMRALGRCVGCGGEKSGKDAALRKCFGCRKRDAARNARAYARRRQRGAIAS